jgi:hypothetical protein
MAANGDNQTRITTDPHTDATPFWSPDDSQITFSTNRDGNFEVDVMERERRQPDEPDAERGRRRGLVLALSLASDRRSEGGWDTVVATPPIEHCGRCRAVQHGERSMQSLY